MHSKGKIRRIVLGRVLDNHIHFDVGLADRAKNLRCHAGNIRHALDRQFGLIAIERDAGYDG